MYYFLLCDCLIFSHSLSSEKRIYLQHFYLFIFNFLIKLRHCLTDFRNINSTYINCVPRNISVFLSYVCKCDSKMIARGWLEPTLCLVLGCFLFWTTGWPWLPCEAWLPSAHGPFCWQNSCLHSVSQSQIV